MRCTAPGIHSPHIVFFLSSYYHWSVLSDWRRTVSSNFIDSQVPSASLRYYCCLYPFSSSLRETRCFVQLLSLELVELRIFRAAPASHSALPCYWLFVLLILWRLLSARPLVLIFESCPVSRDAMFVVMRPFHRKASDYNDNGNAI